MHSHLHLLCKGVENLTLAEIMRDFKKYTSKKIIETIINEPVSRLEWMLNYFSESCAHFASNNIRFGKMVTTQNWFILIHL